VINFDFHEYCSLFDFRETYRLIDAVQKEIDRTGYFVNRRGSDAPRHKQVGVIRVNCVDCIDRSNFAEYLLCHYVVRKIVEDIEPAWTNSLEFLSSMWSRTGSALAHQYVGSHALYQDAYRTLYRSPCSAIADGFIAVKRCYQNHMHDGRKQDRLIIASRSCCPGPLKYKEIYNGGLELHLLLTGGIFFSLLFSWGNRRLSATLQNDYESDTVFFSKLFSSVWGGVACLLVLSGILLRRRLFSYPSLA